MCLGWLFSLWDKEDPLSRADPGSDGLSESEAAVEVSSPGFRWTEQRGYTLMDPYMRPQQFFSSSATTPAPPATGGRQTRPAPPTTQPVVDGAGRTKSEMLDEAAGVISMLMPGNDLIDELRVFASEYRQFEHHGPILDRLIAAAEQPEPATVTGEQK